MERKHRSRLLRVLVSTVAVSLTVTTLAACTSAGTGGSGGGSSDTITVGLPAPATTLAAVYYGVDTDIWKKEGLKVKTVTFKGDADLVKAELSGSIDVAIGSLVGTLTAVTAGQAAKVLYAGFDQPAFSWWSVPNIHSVAEGKNQTWGVTTRGSSTDFLTRYAVSKSKLNPDKDIKVIQGGASAARLAAMKAGQIKVNILTEPQTFDAKKLGYNKILDLKDIDPMYPMHVVWSTSKFASSDRAKKFITGLSAAMSATKSNPKAAAKSLADELKIPQDQAEQSIALYQDELFPDGRLPTASSMDIFWQMGIEGGVFKAKIPESKWLDRKFLPASS